MAEKATVGMTIINTLMKILNSDLKVDGLWPLAGNPIFDRSMGGMKLGSCCIETIGSYLVLTSRRFDILIDVRQKKCLRETKKILTQRTSRQQQRSI